MQTTPSKRQDRQELREIFTYLKPLSCLLRLTSLESNNRCPHESPPMNIAALALTLLLTNSPTGHITKTVEWKSALRENGIKLATLNRSKAISKRWISPLTSEIEIGSISQRRVWLTVEQCLDEKSLLVRVDNKRVILRGFPSSYTLHKKRMVEMAYCVTHQESFRGYGKLPVLKLIQIPALREEIKHLEELNR